MCIVYPYLHLLNESILRVKSDWTPPVTPALWGRMHRGHGSDRLREENDTSKQWHEHKTQQIEIPHEERQKKWYDLDDQRKKELEVRTFGLVMPMAI